jgi:hypothetical protein
VFVIDLTSHHLRQITDPGSQFTDVVSDWSPDGSQLIFHRVNVAGTAEYRMYVVDASLDPTSNETSKTGAGLGRFPRWYGDPCPESPGFPGVTTFSDNCQPPVTPAPTLTPTPLPACQIIVRKERQAYENPAPARTERIQYPNDEKPVIANETVIHTFQVDSILEIDGRYRFAEDPNANESTPTDQLVVHVTKYRTSENAPWQSIDVWISTQGIENQAVVDQFSGDCNGLAAIQESVWNDRHLHVERLRLYSVEIKEDNREWDQTRGELSEIWEGLNVIAEAFELAGVSGESNYQRFRKVMIDGQTPFILFWREGGTSGECFSSEGSNTVQQPDNVRCTGDLKNSNALGQGNTAGYITEQTAVHELGHLFDYRYDNTLSKAVEAVPNISMAGTFHAQQSNWNRALRNCGWQLDPHDPQGEGYKRNGNNTPGVRLHIIDLTRIQVIMGFSVLYPGTVLRSTWSRGLAGWGTYSKEGQENLSLFQQNPANILIEATADMFLNWVYRRITDSPDGPVGDPCMYPLDGNWQGFKNIDINGNVDLQLSGNVRYWWMDQEIGKILPD